MGQIQVTKTIETKYDIDDVVIFKNCKESGIEYDILIGFINNYKIAEDSNTIVYAIFGTDITTIDTITDMKMHFVTEDNVCCKFNHEFYESIVKDCQKHREELKDKEAKKQEEIVIRPSLYEDGQKVIVNYIELKPNDKEFFYVLVNKDCKGDNIVERVGTVLSKNFDSNHNTWLYNVDMKGYTCIIYEDNINGTCK